MSKNKNIPLIQIAVLKPFIQAAKAIGTPIERQMKTLGIPLIEDQGNHFVIPEIPAWRLVRAVANAEGEPLFGLKAAYELSFQDIESVRPLLQDCVNLKGLLERLCQIAPTQSNCDRYVLKEEGDHVWLIQKGIRLIADYKQIELFEVAGMLMLVQLATGEDWRPDEIHFSFDYCHHIDNSEYLNPSKICFSQAYPAIAIPRKYLPQAVPELSTDVMTAPASMPSGLSKQLLSAITSYIGTQKLTKDLLSDLTGMSFRSLQRALDGQKTSYSSVVDQARFCKAQTLLKESDERLLDISLMLGYENASSFTRAFKRWAGVSPKEYRRHL